METGECHNPNGEAQNLTVKLNAPNFVFKIQYQADHVRVLGYPELNMQDQ